MALFPTTEDLGPFWVGDQPSAPIPVEFVDELDSLQPRPALPIVAGLRDPSSTATVHALTATYDPEPDSDVVLVDWAGFAGFTVPGVWSVIFTAEGRRLPALRFVVELDDGWLSLEEARLEWPGMPERDALAFRILAAAKVACIRYLELDPLVAYTPGPGQIQAQLLQARAVWNATKAGPDDSIGADGMTVTVFPLDWTVKQLLRPKRGKTIIR